MTAAALLAAVRADPDADLPRLVYADAVEDAGDAERAEFIRVQCELARLDERDVRRPALEDREHELLDRHEAAWLCDLWQLDEWEWRRGFVDEVSGHYRSLWARGADGFAGHPVRAANVTSWHTGPNWTDGMPPGPWLEGLRRLSLAGTDTFPALLRQLLRSPHLANLTGLDVSQNSVLGDLADVLAGAAFLPGLRELSAGGRLLGGLAAGPADSVNGAGLCRVLAHSPLERLHLPDAGLDAADFERLLVAPFADRLTSLDVADNDLPMSTISRVPRSFRRTGVVALDLSGTALGQYALLPLLSRPALAGVTDLQVSRCGGYHRWYRELSGTAFWPRATSLRAHSADDWWPEDFSWLCRRPGPPALRLLDLADNHLGPDGVRHLADAPWGASLTWLALSRNQLTDDAATALAGCGKFAALRTLHLAFDPLTDAAVGALADAPSLARLRILTLSHTRLTDAAVPVLLDGPHWRLSGLGLAGCDLGPRAVHALASSPRLYRIQWLDLSGNPGLGGDTLLPLAESPHLSRLCELDIGGCGASDRVRAALRERLGRRLSD